MNSNSSHAQDDDDDEHDIDSDEMIDDEIETPIEPTLGKRTKEKPSDSSSNPRKKKTRSEVWTHFTWTKEDYNRCTCNYCGASRSYLTKSGTSNLNAHLKLCKQYQASLKNDSGGKKHANVTSDGRLQKGMVSEQVWREATNELIVLAELPFAFVENIGWRHFCKKVESYTPHSRRTATRDIMEIYASRKADMKKLFAEKKQRVSLTTDIWVAPTTLCSYMVITAHFIDSDWKLKKAIIGFKNVDDHTGDTIASCLLDCLDDWGIEKVFTITVDNATANTNAISKFTESFQAKGDEALILNGENLHLRYVAHIINLIVKDGLHEADKSVCSVRNSVLYLRGSTKRMKAFEDKLDSGKVITQGSLPLDVSTRWNSTYLMLVRALKFRVGFDKMELEDRRYNDYFLRGGRNGEQRIGPPLKKDWDEIDRLVSFLVVFYHSTLIVSASTKVNAHLCYNEIVTIQRNLIRLSQQPDLELQESANWMIAKFEKYWGGLSEVNMLLIVASVLDPRNKMEFAEMCLDHLYGKDNVIGRSLLQSVKMLMEGMFKQYGLLFSNKCATSSQSHSTGGSSQTSQSQSSQQDQIAADIDDDFRGYERMDKIYKERVKAKGVQEASNELRLYLTESVENPVMPMGIEFDVLSWWRVNAPKFPVLSEMARDVLAMQVSSVASESAFSTSRRILDPFRSALTHSSIEALMCTEQWLKCEVKLTEKGAITIKDLIADIELQDKLQRELGL